MKLAVETQLVCMSPEISVDAYSYLYRMHQALCQHELYHLHGAGSDHSTGVKERAKDLLQIQLNHRRCHAG